MVAINRETDDTNMVWQLIDRDTGGRTRTSIGNSQLAIKSRSGSSTRRAPTTRCRTRSTFTVPDASWSSRPTTKIKRQPRLEGHRPHPRRPDHRHPALMSPTPGRWMAHCHIAEHNQSGMMFSFKQSLPRPSERGCAAGQDGAASADRLGCSRWSSAGGHTACLLVARHSGRLRARACGDRRRLHRLRRRRRTPQRSSRSRAASTFVFVVIGRCRGDGHHRGCSSSALAGHGLKDLWQHRSHFVANTRWWPPFCHGGRLGRRARSSRARSHGLLPRADRGDRFVISRARRFRSAPAWRERWDSLTLFTPRRLQQPCRGSPSRATRAATRRATR